MILCTEPASQLSAPIGEQIETVGTPLHGAVMVNAELILGVLLGAVVHPAVDVSVSLTITFIVAPVPLKPVGMVHGTVTVPCTAEDEVIRK